MSSEKIVVSLKLQSGERFDDISVDNPEWTLAEFLDQALKRLEDESEIQLPDTDDDLIDPRDFKVYAEQSKRQLNLGVPLVKQSYFEECELTGRTPVLYLVSAIFRNAQEVEKEEHVRSVLRRQSHSEGKFGRTALSRRPPRPPTRSSSLTSRGTSRETLVYLAGRKQPTPVTGRMKHSESPSNLSYMSDSTTSYQLDEHAMERIINPSISSEDTGSIYSFTSSSTCADQGQGMPAIDGHPSRILTTRPGSAPVQRSPRSTEQYLNLRRGSGDGRTSPYSISEMLASDSQSGDGVSLGHDQRLSLQNPEGSTPKSMHPSSVTVVQGFTIIEETVEDLPKTSEAEELITEEKDLTVNGHRAPETPTRKAAMLTGRVNRNSREISPGLLERPISPDQEGVSPGSSPQRSRKTRLATKRGKTKILARRMHSSPPAVGETTGSADGRGVRGSSPASPPATATSSPSRSMTRNRRTIYDRHSRIGRVSMFLPHSTKVFGNIRTFTVDFEIPAADIVAEMDVRGDYTVGQIKENLWSLLREQGFVVDEFILLWDPEKFTFTYQMKDQTYELYDEQQIFQTATVVQLWRSEKKEKGHLMVEMKKVESREEKTMNMQISAMIGIGLYQLQFANNDELDITRRKMVAVRRNAVRSRDPSQYRMESELFFQHLPPHVMEQIHDDKFLIRVYYKEGRYQTLQVDADMTADDVLPLVFPEDKAKRQRLGLPEQCNIDDYVLKVAGQDSYIHGFSQLLQFSYIVRTLGKKQDVELALVRRLDPAEDLPREIPDWNLIDESTGLTGTHHDLSALSKEHTQVFTISMWDIQRKFRIRVVGLDNLRTPEAEVVYIEAGIFHGGELLVQERFTQEVAASTYPRWNQWLVFDIAVKNLPKAARLCIQVIGGSNRSKDTKKKGTRGRSKSLQRDDKSIVSSDKCLHWVNLQILDHRALLRQGLLRLNLWPVLPDSSIHSTHMTPMGSTAINPDGNNSAVVYIELDTYAHPVACPTGGWGEDRMLSPEQLLKEGSRFQKDLEKSISSDPLATLDKAQKELIWKFRAYCATIPEALPKFLRCVNWADLDKVCEAHRLLKIWRPITLEVALELLDYHFADDKVRSLAVRRLELLTSDELLCYLLQLIQVLKFEPYHDSALAQYLLKRALQSKRIGHFFYWYLRSEMDTPEFNQRFGILLEAYLRGCGEAMFQEIQRQHKAVCDVMAVAGSLKKYMEKHKGVAEFAREELAKYQLPDSFSPPYNPSLKMGNLSISKCRVMDSKKSPLWLEFQNMDPTCVTNKPIKVIAKHGDDLRQDMLTLQMLSLMDKLWQANGLDLYIIPYGCIATGNMMGMIEVVQEAETVAKIQQKHGGSFSTFKEEPLHDWLRKQNQSHFDAVVEKFVLSCAGYCVATYVLGIGDRHNDNIMLTTSGNLFHIDFGHFLGNRKEFMGLNRERAPFVLTPDFEYVMGKRGSEMYMKFEDTAIKAYMIIRQHANLFINLFSMMKCTGIPELRSVEDIDYLRSVLVLEKGDAAAREHFRSQIQKCQKVSWSTQLNWLAHIVAHRHS